MMFATMSGIEIAANVQINFREFFDENNSTEY